MNRFSRSFVLTLVLAPALLATPARAQLLTDYAITADQQTVGSVFDAQASTAPVGSTLETDYNRLFIGSSTDIAHETQSMLPTTSYNLSGVANALANVEETNLMGRLRALRNKDLASVRKNVASAQREQAIKPLQSNDEALHDLRTGTKAPSITGHHGTLNNYRMLTPLIYKNGVANPETDPNPTMAERTYNETMRLSSIGAGAPNATTRDTDVPKVRNVPNMADRVSTQALQIAGDTAGQGQINATAQNGLPRHAVVRVSENDKTANALYRGQPLRPLAATDPQIPVPLSAPASQPVLYGAQGDSLSALEPMPAPAAAPVQPVFKYKKIDQSKGLTTPMLGSPSSATLLIKQANAYAIPAIASANNLNRTTEPRATTEAGTLLWMNPKNASSPQTAGVPALPAQTDAASSLEDSSKPALYPPLDVRQAAQEGAALVQDQQPATKPERPTYGTTAIPLGTAGAGINADRRWGFFVSGDTGFGSDAHQTNSAKAKTVTTGFTAGADYRIQDQSFVGMALTYAHTSFTTGSLGDLQGNSTALSLYGTTSYLKDAYVDGYISMGYHSLDSERTIMAGDNSTRKAKASPDGIQFNGKAETGYDVKNSAWTYGPFAGFRLAYADFDGTTEKGAGSFNLKVRGLDTLSAIGGLGVGGSYRMAMQGGGVLLPAMRVGYNHEFGDDRSKIKAEFADLASSGFTTSGEKKSRDWVSLAPSISAALPNDWTLLAQYEHDFFRDDANENIFNLAAHYKW